MKLGPSTEISERRPWTVLRAREHLNSVGPIDARHVCQELRSDETFTPMLHDVIGSSSGRQRLNAAALLLTLNDEAGCAPFLEALGGPDGDVRAQAIQFLRYGLCPQDLTTSGIQLTKCPIRSDDVYAALGRDLHEPWTGQSLTVLEILSRQDYPQVHSITRQLLTHSDPVLRRTIAKDYLRAGRDEGAFAVVEELMRNAPGYISHRDPRWTDFYELKELWFCVEKAAEVGSVELKKRAAGLALETLDKALSASDCAKRFDVNDGFISANSASKALAMVMPSGAKDVLERLVLSTVVNEFYRGSALAAYSDALGDEARPFVLAALQNDELREYAANAMGRLIRNVTEPQDITALSEALSREERPRVVSALAKALVAAGREGREIVQPYLDRSDPWTRVGLSWQVEGGTDREFADLLTECGVMDRVSDEQLADALSKGFDILSLIWAGGQRLVVFNTKSGGDLEHFELFRGLLGAARPTIEVEDLKETCEANVLREPVDSAPRIEKVTDLGTVCSVSFQFRGQPFDFKARPRGRWHDVVAVMRGFDSFMAAIGRDDRCYELKGDGEYAMFVVAPAQKFGPLAVRLGIPIELNSESARDAAKAFQRQVQNNG